MARRKVIWTKNAELLFKEILTFYFERNQNKTYSKKLLQKVKSLTNKLSRFPFLGFEIETTNYREIIFDHYSIIYSVSENEVVIKLIWDHRRNPDVLRL
ncbi:type II toxin-antitoxin system RelE/ParE family toxin [Lacihabitans sp. LS3-19]|uniref:type II toxin-antitoxin system RelE/ParE family toxin n=1 Tax=Lacihabitans sp. LS3-19 TaxID=2487335 RepID=UPI0020CF39F8|nr:type II toxin-antitoxin system RelE/ParE family toxin [Lacihabitans sp. LS3-19]MCP9770715.1 type II toxin-antitoxin system RelE/ParE family toxin [Lacihabitans sp. LS3-19]